MEFSDFKDSIEISSEYTIFQINSRKNTEINLEELDFENSQLKSMKNSLNLCIMSGTFGEFDRKKSQKNIEILCNVISMKNNICSLIKK